MDKKHLNKPLLTSTTQTKEGGLEYRSASVITHSKVTLRNGFQKKRNCHDDAEDMKAFALSLHF